MENQENQENQETEELVSTARKFHYNISGPHPEGLPEKIYPKDTFKLALEFPEHMEYLQELALTEVEWAARFAQNVPGADIKRCQEKACEDPQRAYTFAKNVPGADIAYCQEHAIKSPFWAWFFAQRIKGADVNACYEAVKGSPHQAEFEEWMWNL